MPNAAFREFLETPAAAQAEQWQLDLLRALPLTPHCEPTVEAYKRFLEAAQEAPRRTRSTTRLRAVR